MAWARLRGFAPTELQAKLSEVERLHRLSAPPSDPPPDLVENLCRLLMATAVDDIPLLASTLTKQEICAIADLLAAKPARQIETKAILLGIAAKLEGLVARCWRLLVHGGPLPALERIVGSGVRQGLSRAIAEPASGQERLEAWFGDAGLLRNVLNDLEGREQRFEVWLEELPKLTTEIGPDSTLSEEIRAAILTDGSESILKRQHHDLLPWVTALSQESRSALTERFAANYLHRLKEDKSWDAQVIDWLIRRLGNPRIDNLVDAWRRIDKRSPGVVRALISWLALKELEKFFREIKDPHGRFRFWRRNFADDFADVEGLADRDAMLLHIPPLAVIEFAHRGNAAYVYHESELNWLSIRGSYGVNYYKRREKLVKRPSDRTEFRIIHSDGWQDRYLNDLKLLVNRRRQGR